MSIKRMYYYLFYKLYKHYEDSSEPWWSDWKAGASIGVLEIWLLLSLGAYYAIMTKISIQLSITMPIIYIPLIIIFIKNYFSFIHTNVWKIYNTEFDQLSKQKNRIGGWIIFGIILLIITNLIFSFYLLYSRAKQNQTGPYSKEYMRQEKIKDSIDHAKYIKEIQDIKDKR